MASTVHPLSRLVDRIEVRMPKPVRVVFERARGQDILLFASGLSFYALVSVVPLAIFVIWVSSLIFGDQRIHALARELGHVAPKNLDVGGFVRRVSNLGTSLGVPALITAIRCSRAGSMRCAAARRI